MNLDVANQAHALAQSYRAVHVPGHEDSFETLAELASHIEERARADASDEELMSLSLQLTVAEHAVSVGLASDRIARAAGYNDHEGADCD
ncbi:MAG: hypothetical protein RLZZ584_2486 [Pseudomonadota bacterium]|jgi:hypothetical protein